MTKITILICAFAVLLVFTGFTTSGDGGSSDVDYGRLKVVQPIYDCQDLDVENTYYILQNDIITEGTCFVVRANNVILDLNGYSITGDKRGNAVKIENYNSLIIKRGVVSNFSDGIEISNSNNNIIENVEFYYNDKKQAGIYIEYSNYNLIKDNIFDLNDGGVYIKRGSDNTVTNNIITNSWAEGIALDETHNNAIENNYIANNLGEGIGLFLADNNNLRGNEIENNDKNGIELTSSNNNFIENNSLRDNSGNGIDLHSNSNNNIIKTNYVENNAREGIGLSRSTDNLIESNYIENNSIDGIELEDSNYNIVKDNDIENNAWNGIHLDLSNYNLVSENNIIKNANVNYIVAGLFIDASDFNTIEYNNIYGNGDYNLYLYDKSDNVTAENNYWGPIDADYWGAINEDEIAKYIHDFYDNPELGIVDFCPFLDAPYPGGNLIGCYDTSLIPLSSSTLDTQATKTTEPKFFEKTFNWFLGLF